MSVRAALIAAGVPAAIAKTQAPYAEKAMRRADITSQRRAEQFLAQLLHESGGLRYRRELASGQAYEGRADLGNTHPRDGMRYRGRGWIQITGRANARAAGKALGLPLEAHPELMERSDVAWLVSTWFWTVHGLNALADHGNIVEITHRINGGENGLASRRAYLARLQRVDCRPVDRWAGYTPMERRLITEYDRLLARHADPRRRRVLRLAMGTQRKLIWRAAQHKSAGGDGHGWAHANRRARYESLLARS
jgi:predicted chitinase